MISGNQLTLPSDLEFGVKPVPATNDRHNYSERQNEISELRKLVHDQIRIVSDEREARCDGSANNKDSKEGKPVKTTPQPIYI